jgi:hypothetical protein
VLYQVPFGRIERCHHFEAAAAAAQMRGDGVAARDVEDAGFKPVWDECDKLRPKMRAARHDAPSTTISPLAME